MSLSLKNLSSKHEDLVFRSDCMSLQVLKDSRWVSVGLFVFWMIGLIEPSMADIFTKPLQKGTAIKTGLLSLSKVAVAISFVASLIAALAGRINWRWVGVIASVALAIAGFDLYLQFLEIN